MTKTNTPTNMPAAKRVVITLEIGESKKGMRALVISGAPAGEMPLIKAGTFAERHALLDQMWADLLRRPDQTPTITEPKPAKTKPDKVDVKESVDVENEPAEVDAETDSGTEPSIEQPAAGGPPETDSDQLRDAPVGVATPVAEPPAELPAIENDPTAISPLEAAIIASKESYE